MREIAILMIAALSLAGFTFVVTKPAPLNLSRIPQSALKEPTNKRERSRRTAQRQRAAAVMSGSQEAGLNDIEITWEIVSSTPIEQGESPDQDWDAADRIEPGMLAADLVRIHGTPELCTKQLHEHKFIEHYIYTSPDKTATTQAVLENGRTVHVHTR